MTIFANELKKLTSFNPYLVYGFTCESPPNASVDDETNFVFGLFSAANQYYDMLSAYLLLQNQLLPQALIKEQRNETNILKWLSMIHKEIGNHVSKMMGKQSGVYTPQQLFRWHHGAEVQKKIAFYFKKPQESPTLRKKLITELEQLGVRVEDGDNFITLLQSLGVGGLSLNAISERLVEKFNNQTLTAKELTIVNKLMTITMPVDKIPTAMSLFARKLSERWQSIDAGNLQALSEWLAEVFYELYTIHPYVNANKRTSMGLINLILRSINLPSIPLKRSGDCEEHNQALEAAMNQLDATRRPLAAHILRTIQDEMIRPYEDYEKKNLIIARVHAAAIVKEIKASRPAFSCTKVVDKVSKGYNNTTVTELMLVQGVISALSEEVKGLGQSASAKLTFISSLNNSEEIRQNIKNSLEKLTQVVGWRTPKNEPGMAWIKPDEAQKRMIIAALQPLKAHMTIEQRVDGLIICKNINYAELLEKTNEQSTARSLKSLKI